VIERGETMLFSDTEVLLDCQAEGGVFKNSDLLRTVGPGRPIRINGINKDAALLTVTERGDFKGICSVGFYKNAVAKVISMAVMIDSGANVVRCDKRPVHRRSPEQQPFASVRTEVAANGGEVKPLRV
jgi:hypothetical protein